MISPYRTTGQRGFSLIETLVAISLLTISIVAPMSLVTQSLSSAFYARDQVTAFHLAQEAIESVRAARDANVLQTAYGAPTDILAGIPNDTPFVVDTRDNSMDASVCLSGTCPPLETNGQLYGYGQGDSSWEPTRFTRTVRAEFVDEPDEIRLSVTVSWRTASFQIRSFTISENLYRWLGDNTVLPEEYSQSGYYSQGGYYSESSYYSQASYYSQGSYGGTVICTELHRQGLLSDEWLEADQKFGATMPQYVMEGYHLWAKPIVGLMQNSERMTAIVAAIATPWAHEMAYQMGAAEEGSFVGKVMMAIGIPVSGAIGIIHSALTWAQ